jgi:hypothetical protein
LSFTVREIGIKGIDVDIVWHPGWPIAHPLVEQGRAVQLWPDPISTDFAALPEVHPGEFGFSVGGVSCAVLAEERLARAIDLKSARTAEFDSSTDVRRIDFETSGI